MKVVVISDTHGMFDRIAVPPGDLLIHAGDITARGLLPEVAMFDHWLRRQPHKHKVVIAGNHDWAFQRAPDVARSCITDAHYLEDQAVMIEGFKIWGSPWQPRFYDWAFNLERGPAIRRKWDLIPDDTDILITHGPPFKVLDGTQEGSNVGCADLTRALERVKPRAHVFGHIHHGYGQLEKDGTFYVNASVCTERYRPTNPPIVFEL